MNGASSGWRIGMVAIALAAVTLGAEACKPKLQGEAGRGDEVDVLGIGWDKPVGIACDDAEEKQFHLLGRLDRWKGRAPNPENKQIWDVSITPFIRWPIFDVAGRPLSLDVGIGLHAISHTRINAERKMSTAFQFGELIGLSVPLGAHGDYELGVRLQHVSNGGMKHPNDGITYPLITLSRWF